MDLTLPTTIKDLLAKYETRPSKGLGQNFLIDKNVLKKIVEAADIKSSDIILEVGPGLGTLTCELAKYGGKIISIEKDQTMVKILKETLNGYKHIEIINGDILKLDPVPNALNYKVVANIPYYLTSPLIRKFLESKNQPEVMVLMLQKEVAQRICSNPPDMSLLAVSVQFYADAKIVSYVSKNCFWPTPKVDSAIIKIIPRSQTSRPTGGPTGGPTSPDLFFKIVKAGFSQPRKQLVGNLSKALKLERAQTETWLLKNDIKPSQRAETLSVSDWQNLAKTFCI